MTTDHTIAKQLDADSLAAPPDGGQAAPASYTRSQGKGAICELA
jgi:hypothetical protein